jgi:preprotein translocase subunit SecB
MNDPNKAPGFQFINLVLLRASVELKDLTGGLVSQASIDFRYSDSHDIVGQVVRVTQEAEITILADGDPEHVLLIASVVQQGSFQASEEANIDSKGFALTNAPAIMFPYLREWIQRLTSHSGFPPVVLPPLNVAAMRASQDA